MNETSHVSLLRIPYLQVQMERGDETLINIILLYICLTFILYSKRHLIYINIYIKYIYLYMYPILPEIFVLCLISLMLPNQRGKLMLAEETIKQCKNPLILYYDKWLLCSVYCMFVCCIVVASSIYYVCVVVWRMCDTLLWYAAEWSTAVIRDQVLDYDVAPPGLLCHIEPGPIIWTFRARKPPILYAIKNQRGASKIQSP